MPRRRDDGGMMKNDKSYCHCRFQFFARRRVQSEPLNPKHRAIYDKMIIHRSVWVHSSTPHSTLVTFFPFSQTFLVFSLQVNPFQILSKVTTYAEPGGVKAPSSVADITGEHPPVSEDNNKQAKTEGGGNGIKTDTTAKTNSVK